MKINLDQSEIQSALVEFISNQGIETTGKGINVKLTASRGPAGHTAEITITKADVLTPEGEETEDAIEASEGDQAISFDFVEEE